MPVIVFVSDHFCWVASGITSLNDDPIGGRGGAYVSRYGDYNRKDLYDTSDSAALVAEAKAASALDAKESKDHVHHVTIATTGLSVSQTHFYSLNLFPLQSVFGLEQGKNPYSSQFFEYSLSEKYHIGHTLIDHNAWSKKFWKMTFLLLLSLSFQRVKETVTKKMKFGRQTIPVSPQLQIGSPVVWIGWTWGVVGTTWRQLRIRSTAPAPPSPLAATPGTRLPPVLGTSTWITA